MLLSPHFSLAELSRTEVRGFPNDPPPSAIGNLERLCWNVLEPVRKHFDAPVIVHSAYRSTFVNQAVGGRRFSQHLEGKACDFHVVGVDHISVAKWIDENCEFDQLILEFVDPTGKKGWVHVSYDEGRNRGQVLWAHREAGRSVYEVVGGEIPLPVVANE